MKEETSVRQVMYDMQVELADTLERLSKIQLWRVGFGT